MSAHAFKVRTHSGSSSLGNVAFVQGFDDEKSSYNGKDNSGTYNWLDVWENRNGRWVSVATQLTRVQAKQ